MTYDCFIFFNELDLLEIRLNTLDAVVDKFVLVEATKTFTNKDKPLHYAENKVRFEKFAHKIIHIVVDTYPEFDTAWTFEYHQRNSIVRGLTECVGTDTLLISDLDEIPNPKSILKYKDTPGVKIFKQKMFYYYVNNINIMRPYWVDLATKMLSYKEFKDKNISIEKTRFLKGELVHEGGWHFSYLGGAEAIALKIKSFAHQEFNSEEYINTVKIKERIESGEDLFSGGGTNQYAAVPLDDSFPPYIVKNQEKFKRLIREVNITRRQQVTLKVNLMKHDFVLYLKQLRNKLLLK